MADDFSSGPLCTVTLTLPAGLSEEEAGALSSAFGEEGALSVSMMQRKDSSGARQWVITWLMDQIPDQVFLQDHLGVYASNAVMEEIPAGTNWLEQSYRQFQPFTVGPFFIHGSHYEGTVPPGRIGLQVDAATAFGSGEHGTTAGCLEALVLLQDAQFIPKRILDMGTGSGILAIAAWKLWQRPVLAVDIDPESIVVAERHRAANSVPAGQKGMFCIQGDGFDAEDVQWNAPWDLTIANILSGPLQTMAPGLCDVAAQGGYIILSGMLHDQAAEVLSAYEGQGCSLIQRIDRGEWSTLLLKK